MTHEVASSVLWEGLMSDPDLKVQTEAILKEDLEADPEFLGFMAIYYAISLLIPIDRVIYDMGCNHGFQAWFFRNHRKYIGVDNWSGILIRDSDHEIIDVIKEYINNPSSIPEGTHWLSPPNKFLKLPNTEYYSTSIKDFIACHTIDPVHFAICSYVPNWGGDNKRFVREAFEQCFVYYPKGDSLRKKCEKI